MDASEVDRLSDVEQKQRRDVTGNGVAHSATNGSPGLGCHENTALPRNAERLARTLIDRIGGAITRPRQEFLDEDYLVFTITRVEDAESAASLLTAHGDAVAQLLRCERSPLSAQEREDVLRIAYFADDLVIATWSSAFIRDTESGAQAAIEILEFANSQLREFRYYDQLLDVELDANLSAASARRMAVQLARAPLFTRGQAGALAVHRRQRTDRSH